VTTTTKVETDLTPLRKAAGFFVDDRAVLELWQRSVNEAPDVTVDEVRSCMATKGAQILNSPSTRNPVPVLVVSVPNAIRDGWLAAFRAWNKAAQPEYLSPSADDQPIAHQWIKYHHGEGPSPLTGKMRGEDASEGVKRTERSMILWAESVLGPTA
jgi:hypothetical protein